MKKTILAFIIGGIVFSSITATAAYVYTARDIGYQPNDENWNVTNADQALTSLKNDLNTVNTNVLQYKQQITEALADKGVEVNENSSMADITSGITNMGATDVYYLGTGTSFNIKNMFPNDYQKFTNNNFITSIQSVSYTASLCWGGAGASVPSNTSNVSRSYNASTGVLTVSMSQANVSAGKESVTMPTSYTAKVYLVVGSIESVN